MNPFIIEMLARERQRELLATINSPSFHRMAAASREPRGVHLIKPMAATLGKILVQLGNRLQRYGCRTAGSNRCAG